MDITVTVPAGPLWAIARLMMPPRIDFGSPVQRQKDESECHYHVPIKIFPKFLGKIGPATMGGCWVYMDRYEGNRITDRIRLCWGDAAFNTPGNEAVLRRGHTLLVPIVWRSEVSNDGKAFITDSRHFGKDEQPYPLLPDRGKHRFKLRVKSGSFERTSPHFYIIRVPVGTSNGHFTVEIEYEGQGSTGERYVAR